MVTLSFSILSLWKKNWYGQKTRSNRPLYYQDQETGEIGKNEKMANVYKKFQAGEKVWLDLYWKQRSAINRRKMFIVPLTDMIIHTLGSMSEADFVSDGFIAEDGKTAKEIALTWFSKTYPFFTKLNSGKIEEFEMYQLEWNAGDCRDCIHWNYSADPQDCKLFQDVSNNFQYLQPWPNGMNLCPYFFPKGRKPAKPEDLTPKLVPIKELIEVEIR